MNRQVVQCERSTDDGRTWVVIEIGARSVAAYHIARNDVWSDGIGNLYRRKPQP